MHNSAPLNSNTDNCAFILYRVAYCMKTNIGFMWLNIIMPTLTQFFLTDNFHFKCDQNWYYVTHSTNYFKNTIIYTWNFKPNNWKKFKYTWDLNKVRELANVCFPWQHSTIDLVWFDDVDILAFHSCVVVDLWQSLSEWHLLLSA